MIAQIFRPVKEKTVIKYRGMGLIRTAAWSGDRVPGKSSNGAFLARSGEARERLWIFPGGALIALLQQGAERNDQQQDRREPAQDDDHGQAPPQRYLRLSHAPHLRFRDFFINSIAQFPPIGSRKIAVEIPF